MALNPADIATVSRLLDDVLALDPAERETWLAALPAEHQRHAQALRDMLAQQAQLDTDPRLDSMPKMPNDEAVAHANDRIGPYRLLHEIGRGGMGSVWLAERADGAYKRQVALKLPRLAWGAGLAERMAREREIGMLLEHPNIARLYDAGVDERGRPFLALEFVDGQPIDAWCEAQGLSVRDRLRLFVQVAKAVAYAHGRLVVHRDLKPSNVLVTPDGQAHLLDFGIAKLLLEAAPGEAGLTQEQGRVLTPHYASPEQVAGEAITVQSDVYSLGVLLYELLTGVLPIDPKRSTLGAVEDAILQGDAPPPSSRVKDRATARALRGEVDAILAKAMQREPGRRYATADALAQDIERHLNGETVAARPDSVAYRLRKAVRRHWVGVSAVAAVLVAVLSGSGVAVVQAQRAARSAERERVVKDFVSDVFRVNSRVDPGNAALRPASTQSLIENGAQLIQQRFSGQPELQAELYGVVGGVFSDMGAHKLAADYSTRRVEALTLQRADRIQQAGALLSLAQALFENQQISESEPRARRAVELARGDSMLELDTKVFLSRVQLASGRLDDAGQALDEVDRRLAAMDPMPTSTRAWAMAARARLLYLRSRFDEGTLLQLKAIDMALAAEGTLSVSAVPMRLEAARQLAYAKRGGEAQVTFDAAVSTLENLGGAHAVRAALESAKWAVTRWEAAGEGSWQGIGLATRTRVVLDALQRSRSQLAKTAVPVPDWFVPEVDRLEGHVRATFGDIAGALPLLEASVPTLMVRLDAPGARSHAALIFGRTLMYAGRHAQAEDWLRVALAESGRSGARISLAVGYFWLAQNQMMRGYFDDADAILDQAPSVEVPTGSGSDAGILDRWLVLQRIWVRLARGDGVGAEALANATAWTTEELSDSEIRKAHAYAKCAVGRHGEGLPILKQLIEAEDGNEKSQYRFAPWDSRMRAMAGLCALTSGDRSLAAQYATQARAAFTAQPGVSPYYKAPLIKLERALGLRLPPV